MQYRECLIKYLATMESIIKAEKEIQKSVLYYNLLKAYGLGAKTFNSSLKAIEDVGKITQTNNCVKWIE